jgi:hypothetical protein
MKLFVLISDKIVKSVSSIYDFIMFREFGNENVAW